MNLRLLHYLVLVVLCASLGAESQTPNPEASPKAGVASSPNQASITKVPSEVILVKGASPSSSDSVTPVPEGATVSQGLFSDPYFGIAYPLPEGWTQEYLGPPPSESGRYVLAQIGPAGKRAGANSASMLITAQDMFFTPLPATDALELTAYLKNHLQADYAVETSPTLINVAGRTFSFFAYWSPAAELHWYVLGIEIRCHVVQFILTGRDTNSLHSLLRDMSRMKLPTEVSASAGNGGGSDPVCIKDYARDSNVMARVDPVFTQPRFDPAPVRIVINRQGRIKHIHVISAFPDQARAITDALGQWRFKPYLVDGKPTEVETGIMFGRAPHAPAARAGGSSLLPHAVR
jgi:hypothetical protein